MKILMNGLIKENPTFVLLLGMCPTLATTTSAINGFSHGIGNHGSIGLYQLCDFMYQEDYPGYGSHPCFHRRDCSLRNHPSDADECLCS